MYPAKDADMVCEVIVFLTLATCRCLRGTFEERMASQSLFKVWTGSVRETF
jgi:hypothetical protein